MIKSVDDEKVKALIDPSNNIAGVLMQSRKTIVYVKTLRDFGGF